MVLLDTGNEKLCDQIGGTITVRCR